MSISYSCFIYDMNWESSSGMIIKVIGRYVGIKTCTVNSLSETFTHHLEKKIDLNVDDSITSISINEITKNDVLSWLNSELAEEIPFMKKEIYDALFEKSQEFIRDHQVEEYIFDKTILAIRGGAGSSPNNSWT